MSRELLASFYLKQPVFEDENLEVLESLLDVHLPPWREVLKVGANEDDDLGLKVEGQTSLAKAVNEKAVIRSGNGAVVLREDDGRMSLRLISSRLTLPFESNRCSFEIDGEELHGANSHHWLGRVFLDAVARMPVRYACAYLRSERRAKNLLQDASGTRAVGVDFDSALPGLYWLNFFGEEYVELIGADRFMHADAYSIEKVGRGFVIQLSREPSEWNSESTIGVETSVTAALGEEYFYSKAFPERKTVAPDFWGG